MLTIVSCNDKKDYIKDLYIEFTGKKGKINIKKIDQDNYLN